MTEKTHVLVLDLVEWVAARPRAYAEVMEAWRTSCPRLPVWEDATDQGLVAREHRNGVAMVTITPLGQALLEREGRLPNTNGSSAATKGGIAFDSDPAPADPLSCGNRGEPCCHSYPGAATLAHLGRCPVPRSGRISPRRLPPVLGEPDQGRDEKPWMRTQAALRQARPAAAAIAAHAARGAPRRAGTA